MIRLKNGLRLENVSIQEGPWNMAAGGFVIGASIIARTINALIDVVVPSEAQPVA